MRHGRAKGAPLLDRDGHGAPGLGRDSVDDLMAAFGQGLRHHRFAVVELGLAERFHVLGVPTSTVLVPGSGTVPSRCRKAAMPAADFLRGLPIAPGTVLP